MKKLKELRQVTKVVTKILEQDTVARNDDSYLYVSVIKEFENILGLCASDVALEVFLTDPIFKGFPCFETVRRSRQKVQSSRLDLASDKRINELRKIAEQDYRAFAEE